MSQRIISFRLAFVFLLFVTSLLVWMPTISYSQTEDLLTVRFLDVDQGDAIHIETPDGYELLIDGGPTASVLRELSKGRPFADKYIDMVVATHPDADHIGGLVDVLERYQVDVILDTGQYNDTPTYQAYKQSVENENSQVILARAGQIISLGASTTIKILSPAGDTTGWASNNSSVILKVTYGEIDFMLTGDASDEIENYLVGTRGDELESEVLKLGHHGSKTSTSELFLDATNSDFAIVSAGRDNRYGHPSQEVISRVEARGIEILETAQAGTVVFKTDGEMVWLE